MNFNEHLELAGKHSRLSPSNNSWVNYDAETLIQRRIGEIRKYMGTELHSFACGNIKAYESYDEENLDDVRKGFRNFIRGRYPLDQDKTAPLAFSILDNMRYIPEESWLSVAQFINDSCQYKMNSEQPLWYSDNAFGTADAISFFRNKLRIHDLKTGDTQSKILQLEIYAALFCLEYHKDPEQIKIELAIYQFGEINKAAGDPKDIRDLMDLIIEDDRVLNMMSLDGGNSDARLL